MDDVIGIIVVLAVLLIIGVIWAVYSHNKKQRQIIKEIEERKRKDKEQRIAQARQNARENQEVTYNNSQIQSKITSSNVNKGNYSDKPKSNTKKKFYSYDDVKICILDFEIPPYELLKIGGMLDFVQEPANEYDSRAVAVYQENIKIGYLYQGAGQDMTNDFLNSGKTVIGYLTYLDPTSNTAKMRTEFYTSDIAVKKLSTYTVIDLETTGLNPQTCEIIEISAVKIENNMQTEVFTELVKPSVKLSQDIIDLTSITNDMLSSSPSINIILPKFLDFIGNDVLVGHNIDFDTNFLSVACQRLHLKFNAKVVDTLSLSKLYYPELPDHKLGTVCHYLNVENSNAHRALSDCLATQEVFEIMQKEIMPTVRDMNMIKLKEVKNKYGTVYKTKTKAIQELKKILQDVVSDNVLTEDEVYRLKEWLINNEEYHRSFPFDQIRSTIENALEDNVLEDTELQEMLKIFKHINKPLFYGGITKMSKSKLLGKSVCIDGDFLNGSYDEIKNCLENNGFVVKSGVSSKVDFLIVGELGSNDWAFDNYGNKILKAMELQFKGKDIKIVKEKTFFKMLENN